MNWTESDGTWIATQGGIRYILIPGGGVFDLEHCQGVCEHLARQKAHGLASWISGEVRLSYRPNSPPGKAPKRQRPDG